MTGNTDRKLAIQAFKQALAANPAEAISLLSTLEAFVRDFEFPSLIVDEDGDLRSPYDGEPTTVIALDSSLRYTEASEIDLDAREAAFWYDGSADYEGVCYTDGLYRPVRLPDGWTERCL